MRSILMTALCLFGIGMFSNHLSAQEAVQVIPQIEEASKVCNHNHGNSSYRIGLNLESGLSRLTNLQDLDVQNSGSGFAAGVSFEKFVIGKSLTITSGVNWANRKMSYTTDIADESKNAETGDTRSLEVTNQGSFVEVPVGIKYRAPLIGNGIKPYATAGVTNQILVKGSTVHKLEATGTQEQFASDLNKYNLGLTIGAGLEFSLGCRTFTAGVQAKRGLKAVKSAQLYQSNSYGVQIGYFF